MNQQSKTEIKQAKERGMARRMGEIKELEIPGEEPNV